ncbi:hypothetical protein G4Z16_11760 [Streptomyces bathyalis]|uniref:Uncharacterized protein n=1 Tax=Streptomyces bathyalis TaxID=2710756 RepID=A0A7T1T5U1_9ACTN|nr:hypothetical protein [Streptomyces bathyalis]QPP06947.1 hypothetical protein G4Z16_11760 [Streptomyces bathyalis]
MTDIGGRTRRLNRRKRIVGAAAAGVVLLGVVAAVVEPYVNDWWVTRNACSGALPKGVLDDMGTKPMDDDRHLYGHEETVDAPLGRYRCEVNDGESGRGYRFRASAYTARDDIDGHLSEDFSGHEPARLALPAGLPGYETPRGDLVMTVVCPRLGRDGSGKPRQLHTRAQIPGYFGDGESGDEPAAGVSYDAGARATVSFANKASEKLRCGAKPLAVPEKVPRPEPVPLGRTDGTPCSVLAHAPLGPTKAWSVEVRMSRRAPVGSCLLERNGDGTGSGQAAQGKEALDLTAFHGDFSRHLWKALGRRKPWVSATQGWATARCEGTDAVFRIRALGGDGETPVLSAEEMRSILTAFAERQADRRGCTKPRVPSRVSADPPRA